MTRDENKNRNINFKILSILAALVLWLYVMAIIDPEERKSIADVPITISNLSEIEDNDLMIYPNYDLETEIVIRGKLSDVQKLNKDNIHVSAIVDNPVEGKNQLDLRTNISNRVSHNFKDAYMTINLEKVVSKYYKIDVMIPDKDKVSVSKTETDVDEVLLTGPRSQMDKVAKVGARVNILNNKNDFGKTIKLKAYDEQGNVVKDVKFEIPTVDVKVIMMTEKKVPVYIDTYKQIADGDGYNISPAEITISGDANQLTNIQSILTEKVKINHIDSNEPVKLNLSFPEGVVSKDKILTVEVMKNL